MLKSLLQDPEVTETRAACYAENVETVLAQRERRRMPGSLLQLDMILNTKRVS